MSAGNQRVARSQLERKWRALTVRANCGRAWPDPSAVPITKDGTAEAGKDRPCTLHYDRELSLNNGGNAFPEDLERAQSATIVASVTTRPACRAGFSRGRGR